MNEPKIIAFLEDSWWVPGSLNGVLYRYYTEKDFLRESLHKSLVGYKLVSAFGPDLFKKIFWTDLQQVEKTIKYQKPDLIITFGDKAEKEVEQSIMAEGIDYMCCFNPNTRTRTMEELATFAISVAEWCDTWRINHERSKHSIWTTWNR